MNKRKLKLEDFGISANRYDELMAFCRQYDEWKQFLSNNNDTVKSLEITDMPICHGNADQTCNLAVKRAEYEKNIKIIEECAKKTSNEFYKFIILNVCYGNKVEFMIDIKEMPMCKRSFYYLRRHFFILLDKERLKS